MSEERNSNASFNPWKWTTMGIVVVLTTALVTGVVVANYVGNRQPGSEATAPDAAGSQQAAVEPPAPRVVQPPPRQRAPERYASARPSAADIEACNRDASSARDTTTDTLKDALIGGAVGAGVGAAGGAIAKGGKGAGKGAGIGGLVGATAGTLFGLNAANQNDARAAEAYRACMHRRGFVD